MTPAYYDNMLNKLLPTGPLWEGLKTLKKALTAWADEFSRVHLRWFDLDREADPAQAVETLADWEKDWGLPDACAPLDASIEERQLAVVGKIAGRGGQTISYYIMLANAYGYSITIDEFDAALCTMKCNAALYTVAWAYSWRVNVLSAQPGRFVDGRCLELECLFEASAQSHTNPIFDYSAMEA